VLKSSFVCIANKQDNWYSLCYKHQDVTMQCRLTLSRRQHQLIPLFVLFAFLMPFSVLIKTQLSGFYRRNWPATSNEFWLVLGLMYFTRPLNHNKWKWTTFASTTFHDLTFYSEVDHRKPLIRMVGMLNRKIVHFIKSLQRKYVRYC